MTETENLEQNNLPENDPPEEKDYSASQINITPVDGKNHNETKNNDANNVSDKERNKTEIKKTPPRSSIDARKSHVKSIAAIRINKLIKSDTKDEEENRWIQNLPCDSIKFQTKFAQSLIKNSAVKSQQGSIIKYMRKRRLSPDYLKQSKSLKHDESITTEYKKHLEFPEDNPNEDEKMDEKENSLDIENKTG